MPQSRKWQLTFNNPADHGFTHDAITAAIENLASVVYWCMCDEVGSEGTYHTHLYICKRQIGVNLHPHGKLGKRGCRDGRRTEMSKLWKRIYSNMPYHAAEILQQ